MHFFLVDMHNADVTYPRMENNQAKADTIPATTTTTAPAAPAVDNLSTQKEQQTALETGDKKLSPADLVTLTPEQQEQLTQLIFDGIPRDGQSGKALLKPEMPAVDSSPASLVETPEVVPTPTEETVPAVAEEVAPAVEDSKAEEAVTTPEPEEPEPTDGKLPQHRTRATNSFDDLVLRRYKLAQADGRPLTMEQCVAAEKAAQGIVTPTVKETPVETKSVEIALKEREALFAELDKAEELYDIEAKKRINREITAKSDEIAELREDAKARKQAESFKQQSAYRDAMNRAASLYPDLAKEGSKIFQAKEEIHAALVANNDPVVGTPGYPLHLAQLAAAQSLTPPVTPGAKKATVSKPVPAPSVQPAKPVAPLAGATARTTPTSKAQTTAAYIKGLQGDQKALNDIQMALEAQAGF